MSVMTILTNELVILGGSGLLGGIWRAVDWYLNHKDEQEDVKKIYITRNIVIGLFCGLNTNNINTLLGNILGGIIIPTIAPIAFMYGMCGELILVTAYNTIKQRINDLLQQ